MVERTIPIREGYEQIELFNPSVYRFKDMYQFLHIGLVQVSLKPLTREGLNACLMVALRDCRHLDFGDSLLGLVETSLCNGQVYFNCFPNFPVSLTDPHILKTLTLNIQTKGYNMIQNSEHVAISYRVYYKVMNTLNPKNRYQSIKGRTTLIEMDSNKSNMMTLRAISWENIQLPEN